MPSITAESWAEFVLRDEEVSWRGSGRWQGQEGKRARMEGR